MEPFQLEAGKDLCDITIVKHEQKGDTYNNLSYPQNTIYFQYEYKNIPLNSKGQLQRLLKMAIATNEYSRFKVSVIKDSNYPSKSGQACRFIFNPDSSGSHDPAGRNQRYYDAVCKYAAGSGTPSDAKISGKVTFAISIKGKQEIRRFTDDEGRLQGAASISVSWQGQNSESNFNM